jgi:hypothetical protein
LDLDVLAASNRALSDGDCSIHVLVPEQRLPELRTSGLDMLIVRHDDEDD